MSGLGSAAGSEMMACRDREVTRARRARSLCPARCPPRVNQTAVFVTRALAAVVRRILAAHFQRRHPARFRGWWFSRTSQPAELPWGCQLTAWSQVPRYLKGSTQVSARGMRWPCSREESSRTRCAASRCKRLARFFGHSTPGSRRKRLFCMPEDRRRSPREEVQPRCESRPFRWRLAPLEPSNADRVPSLAPAAERSTSRRGSRCAGAELRGFVRPSGSPRRDRPTRAARCRAGVVS